MTAQSTMVPGKFYVYGQDSLMDYQNPDYTRISAKHIARGLANNCRWGGNGRKFLSVAQHSVLVFLLSPEPLRQEALFHDGHEAYIGDMPAPLKAILGLSWENIELVWKNAVFKKFDLEKELLPQIKQYDLLAQEMEYELLFLGKPERFTEVFAKNNYPAHVWSSPVAYHQFKRTMRMAHISEHG